MRRKGSTAAVLSVGLCPTRRSAYPWTGSVIGGRNPPYGLRNNTDGIDAADDRVRNAVSDHIGRRVQKRFGVVLVQQQRLGIDVDDQVRQTVAC